MKNLLFLNGDIPFHVYHKLYKNQKNFIIAADGGANHLFDNGIEPNVIIGDLDSISPKVLKYFKKPDIKIIKVSEQETTDFEKSLNFCLELNIKELFVFGAVGERPDHTLNNYSILKRFYQKLNVIIYSNDFEIRFINKSIEFDYRKGKTVSLMPFPKADSILTKGLKYKLTDETLELGKREGSLNLSDSNKIEISFKKGDLLLFKKHFIHNPKN